MARKPLLEQVRTVQAEGQAITYTLIASARRTAVIQVKQSGAVFVRAPIGLPPEAADQFVIERASWVASQRARFSQRPIPSRASLLEQGSVPYLGQPCPLQVQAGDETIGHLQKGTLILTVPNPDDADYISRAIEAWYRALAATYFPHQVAKWHARATALGLGLRPYGRITIRWMATRWGTCSAQGRLTFNARLMALDERLIDYVIAHELCHLAQLNHSPAFWELLARLLPDWQSRHAELNRIAPVDDL